MASTSASFAQKSFKYDVFLSFRGEDTRKNFVDHLCHALHQKGIITYKDNEKIEKGERINDQLIRSIEDSRFHIIVFSKNYASSSWCLEELVKIMECQKTKEQTAYPIFYDVEPTEVRHQSGTFGEALGKHEKGSWNTNHPLDCLCSILGFFCCGSSSSFNYVLVDPVTSLVNDDDVGRWRNALKDASNLAGMELKDTFNGHEAKFIQQIVQEISLKLHFINSSLDGKLVGMEKRVKDIISSLEIGLDEIRMIGIKGIGGGGKTTLARAVFDLISVGFEGGSFVENIREVSRGSISGMKKLQKKVLKDVLRDQNIDVTSVSDGKNMMKRMMPSRKVLVVLDDVDDIDQLDALAGDLTWFKPGSRIIITTRDQQVLVAHKLVNFTHDICLLSDEEAICLFNRYAFKSDIPNQGYEKLSRKVVRYAAGLPLTIKVLGSHLCGRSECEWIDAIERLKRIPLKETLEKLELSYNGLEDDQKEIFLDVVCILKGESKNAAIRMLKSCGYNAHIGLSVLVQKSLITISDNDSLGVHDHIEEMGRSIVRRLHPNDPSRHSRLWIEEEIKDICFNESGTEATRSVKLHFAHADQRTSMKGLRKMKELRLLYVNTTTVDDEFTLYLPDALQSLFWLSYPFRSLPETFQANKLVNLEMHASKIFELWEGGERKVLHKLKFLDLSFSKLTTFDLSVTPNLEVLIFEGCRDFVELQFPIVYSNLRILNLRGSKVSNLNLGMTPHLESLDLRGCDRFVEIHIPVECLNLKVLDLGGSKLRNLNLGMTLHLEELNLEGCEDFVELQLPFECPNLKVLNLRGSKVSKLYLGMIPHLEKLNLEGCDDFTELHMPIELPDLKVLNLCDSKVSSLNLEMTPYLEELNLEKCCNFLELHMPVDCPNLKVLNLSYTKVSNLNLGPTSNLESLFLSGCYFLQEIHARVGCLKKIAHYYLDQCPSLLYFEVNKRKESVGLDSIATVNVNVDCVDVCPLHPNNNLPKLSFVCKYDEPRSSWSGNLEKLISFSPCACKNLEYYSAIICDLQHLRVLTLEGSVPWDLCRLESLAKLTLCEQQFQRLPDSICMLKHLKSLKVDSCLALEQLPKNICELECLEVLRIVGAKSLQDIPSSICKMKCLKRLDLTHCENIKKLPKELGRLERLKVLDLEGVGIICLPRSIYQLNGLRIYGSRGQLEMNGFTTVTEFGRDVYWVEL